MIIIRDWSFYSKGNEFIIITENKEYVITSIQKMGKNGWKFYIDNKPNVLLFGMNIKCKNHPELVIKDSDIITSYMRDCGIKLF